MGKCAAIAFQANNELYETAQVISSAHLDCTPALKDFVAKQEQANSQFLLYFIKFGTIYAKLRKRDEAFEQFKHYYRKLQKLNTDRNFMKSKGLQDSVQENKDQEVIARVS